MTPLNVYDILLELIEKTDGNAILWNLYFFCNRNPKYLNVNYVYPNKENNTLLMLAARYGLVDVLYDFVNHQNKPEINVYGEDDYTALHYAAENGDCLCMTILLDGGANPNMKTEDGYTALHFAVKNDLDYAILLLRTHKADPNAVNIFGISPLRLAIELGCSNAVWGLLQFPELDITHWRKYFSLLRNTAATQHNIQYIEKSLTTAETIGCGHLIEPPPLKAIPILPPQNNIASAANNYHLSLPKQMPRFVRELNDDSSLSQTEGESVATTKRTKRTTLTIDSFLTRKPKFTDVDEDTLPTGSPSTKPAPPIKKAAPDKNSLLYYLKPTPKKPTSKAVAKQAPEVIIVLDSDEEKEQQVRCNNR